MFIMSCQNKRIAKMGSIVVYFIVGIGGEPPYIILSVDESQNFSCIFFNSDTFENLIRKSLLLISLCWLIVSVQGGQQFHRHVVVFPSRESLLDKVKGDIENDKGGIGKNLPEDVSVSSQRQGKSHNPVSTNSGPLSLDVLRHESEIGVCGSSVCRLPSFYCLLVEHVTLESLLACIHSRSNQSRFFASSFHLALAG